MVRSNQESPDANSLVINTNNAAKAKGKVMKAQNLNKFGWTKLQTYIFFLDTWTSKIKDEEIDEW